MYIKPVLAKIATLVTYVIFMLIDIIFVSDMIIYDLLFVEWDTKHSHALTPSSISASSIRPDYDKTRQRWRFQETTERRPKHSFRGSSPNGDRFT